MSDEIIARRETKAPHPDGLYPAVCVDVIDLGEAVDTYQGKTSVLPKLAIVFQTNAEDPETGKPLEIHIEVSNSFGRKARLRKLLEGWRGKPFSDDEARNGVPIHKLEKVNCSLNILHKVSAAGNTYALIDAITPPMKGLAKIEPHGYQRAEFWSKRKADYAAAVAQHRKQNGLEKADELAPSLVGGEEDDLPF
jgi:hypothetical protein